MIILLHTSKTMRSPEPPASVPMHSPALITQASQLASYIKTLSLAQLAKSMHLSPVLAAKTATIFQEWNATPNQQSLAIDSFVGDIYSGLQANSLSRSERDYADAHLRILSGLYGILRPYDGIRPYRLEMGYKLPDEKYHDLYKFWGETIAAQLPKTGPIINLTAMEYFKTILPFVDVNRVIAPRFLTKDATGEPKFVVVHAKIARGAFARWLITHKITDPAKLVAFREIGYKYDPMLSSAAEPAFVCQEFGGKGLSMQLET